MFNKSIKLEINISDNIEIYKNDILEEIRNQLNQKVVNNFKSDISKSIQQIVLEESLKNKKQISENVSYWIKTMPSTELFYRDEFREYLVDVAKLQEKQITEIVKQHINTTDCNKLYDALGNAMANKFYDFIRNENY